MKDVKINLNAAAFPDQFVSDAQKDTLEYGLQVGQAIQYEWFRKDSTSCRYFSQWAEFNRMRLYARGEQPIAKYKNELAIDGDLSYLNLDWTPVPIIPKFVDIVVNGLNDSNNLQSFKLGVIPTGSGNSVAHDTGLLDIKDAISKSLGDNIIKMDLNKVDFDSDSRLSVSVLGWGMFSYGNIRAEKLRLLGPIRYDVASIITLLEKKIHKAEVEVDGKLKLLECAFIVACNSKHTGKGMIIAPKGGFTDKKIDLISVGKDVNRFQVFEVFQKVYKGTHINLPFVKNIKVGSISIDAGKMSYYNIDGDVIKSQKASVRVVPEAIKLLI